MDPLSSQKPLDFLAPTRHLKMMFGRIKSLVTRAPTAREIVNALRVAYDEGREWAAGDQFAPVFSDQSARIPDVPALWAAVNLIANTIATRPFYVAMLDRDNPTSEGEYVKNHPINTVLSMPSPWMSRSLFWSTLLKNMLVSGNAYAHVRRHSPSGRAAELTLAHRTSVIGNLRDSTRGSATIYQLQLATETGDEWIEASALRRDVIRLHGDGYDMHSACSPSPITFAARRMLKHMRLGQAYQDSVYTRGAHQRGFLKNVHVGGEPADYEKIAKILSDGAGVEKARTTRTLPPGWEFQASNFSTIDLALIDVMRWGVEEIARLYGIPPHMIGHMQGNTAWGTGLDNLGASFVQYGLKRHVDKLEQSLVMTLLTADEVRKGLTIRIDMSGAGFGSEDTRMGLAERAVRARLMTPNQARARYLGLPSIEGGDELLPIQGASQPEDARGPGAEEPVPSDKSPKSPKPPQDMRG